MWEHREITLSMSPQWPKLSDVYVKADFTVKKKKLHFYLFEKQTDRHGWRQRERKRKRAHVCACGG